ncbi:MAG: hypothetical protein AABW41_00475 [Nanoarchaeota archaeon]
MADYISKKVGAIEFGLFSPKIITKMAAVKVVTPELYDKEGYPVDGGLMDIRLGVIDPGLRCKTCGGKLKECIGHFGYLELARPVFHIKFVAYIIKILKISCGNCGRLLAEESKIKSFLESMKDISEKHPETIKQELKEFVSEVKSTKKCPHCGEKQLDLKFEKPSSFYEDDKKLTPIEIRSRFEKIPDEDIRAIGINPEVARPEWMILTVLPIPPVTTRPSITLETGERSEDDLTHKLGDIVRINQRLFENINAGAPEVIIEDLWELLQYHVTTFFDNEVTQVPPARHRSGQPLKTLTERIKSKEGRFRHNLAGKRVNYAARTVISPDPKLKFNEVGIPKIVAMELTVPERVTEWNMKYLKRFIEQGPHKYPGANYVLRPDGKKKKITDETKEQLLEELQPGFIVERHLMDGDIAIFNRQPSLHRMSIMCHKIKVLPGKSFRLNPNVCVAPDTLVQLSSGIQRPIDELKNCWKESELLTLDKQNNKYISTELKKFWGLKPEEFNAKCYEITTDTGRKVIATGDHPFYTSEGIKKADNLKKYDKVVIRPLDTPIYKETDEVILTEKEIIKIAPKETYLGHSLKTLKELKLIPLNLIDQRVMILSRLLGHLFGDGTFILNKDNARMIFRGAKEDLENLQRDIRSLGFNPEKIYIKTSGGIISTVKGKKLTVIGSYPCFEIRNKPLALLFAALGAPNGDKVKLRYSVPKWIMNSPDHIKREFIASYFGSELTKPSIRNKTKSNFNPLTFKISKYKENKDFGYEFIKSVEKLLRNFSIKINSIKEETGNIRKDGRETISLCAVIGDKKSVMNNFGKIGYLYSKDKDNVARLAYQYSILKEDEIKSRRAKYKEFIKLRKKDRTYKEISNIVSIDIGILESWSYRYKTASLPSKFIGFKDWVSKNSAGPGLVYENIEKINEAYCPFVYDITTTEGTHNFFANGFLTKNCGPYNADFDGDEMNLHIPQNEEARAEAEILMQVQSHIISPKNGLNIIGCIDDAIVGNYLLTKKLELDKEEAVSLLLSINVENFDKIKKFGKKVSGKEVFSVLLPNDFDFIGTTKGSSKEEKISVIIKKGSLVSGYIDKASIGEEKGALIRSLYKQYGEEIGIDILNKIFRLGLEVLLRDGFTTAISDTDLPEKTRQSCHSIIQEAEEKVNELIAERKAGRLEAIPGYTEDETLEFKILEILNKARNAVGEAVSSTADENNPSIIMAASGAKGSILNLAQMAACVGQQALRGKRIEKGFKNRTLVSFRQRDLSPDARGFIKHGFKHGLSPTEFFFGAMTGRDSLMDTGLRTPKSGYLYRRLANALQDLKVEYDLTVRDANKKIIQFSYGEDGIDISKSEGGRINVKRIMKEVIGE